ncbi:hypothetical protein LTR04_002998 [Oleoguttula sp. CCFEE 6159]|nr:hypothetical protein LTR04_002998 [Oleoguttula sp. CCFEE 6159]
MHIPSSLLVVSALSSMTNAFDLKAYSNNAITAFERAVPAFAKRSGGTTCPTVWNSIAGDLTKMFLDPTNGQCNDDARAAIRAAFHDCGSWDKSQGSTGGCDGSLILSKRADGTPDELNRPENKGLADIAGKLLAVQQKWNTGGNKVSVADVIQFAGSVAIVTCPGGPRVQTYVGRIDSPKGAPDGRLPDVRASGASLFQLFQDKGFSAVDLAALLGAHSTSKQFFVDQATSGQSQDSTPGLWDVKYYGETLNPPAGVFVFPSDTNLAKDPSVGPEFKGFVNNAGKWNGKFADAMLRLSLLGVPGGTNNLIDCTNSVPKGTQNKRDIRAAPINDRVR